MMGSSDRQLNHHTEEEEVDLDADTKESTYELFCDDETAESPHKITLWYKSDTHKGIVDHLPPHGIHRQIGREVTIGRNKIADVLLYEKHMARNFATVTCRTNTAQKISFVLRNACDATKQKRIVSTSAQGRVTDLLPTQEVELEEQATFRLECVEFKVGIELGDVNSKSFELAVKRDIDDEPIINDGNAQYNRPVDSGSVQGTGSIPGFLNAEPSLESAFIGLPLSNSIGSTMNPKEQVIPKYVPLMSQGYGYGVGSTAGPGAALPMTPAMSPSYQMGVHPAAHPHQTQYGYGYCDVPRSFVNHPSALHYQNVVYQRQNAPSATQGQLIERGGGYQPLSNSQPCPCHHHETTRDHHLSAQGMSVGEMTQALSNAPLMSQLSSSPRGIVTNPSTQDHSPVLYPSPANPRFRFPQPQTPQMSPQAAARGPHPYLSDLPRGPPLARLSSDQGRGQSINLHPHIPANVVTTHAVTDTGQSHDMQKKGPVEHEDKPK